jgi:hypothetical protein
VTANFFGVTGNSGRAFAVQPKLPLAFSTLLFEEKAAPVGFLLSLERDA